MPLETERALRVVSARWPASGRSHLRSSGLALGLRTTIVARPIMEPGVEPGLLTLAKIIATLLTGISIIPLLFLFSPGDKSEPEDRLDSEQKL